MKNNIRIDNRINKLWHYFDLCSTLLAGYLVACVIISIVIAFMYG